MPLAEFGFLLPSDVRSEFGFQTGIIGANPAVGAAFQRKVPGDFFEIPISVRAQITTSATVVNRFARIDALDGDGAIVASLSGNLAIPASTTGSWRFHINLQSVFASGTTKEHLPLFPFVFPSGWTFRITAEALQAGDQFSGIGLIVQQYNTGVEPERFRDVTPLDVNQLGLVASVPLGSATPSPVPLPSRLAAPGPSPAQQPAAQPVAAPAPVSPYLADIPLPVRGAPRVE